MDADALNVIGWMALRVTVSAVYLYALYMNTRDRNARQWLIEHTAYMFPKATSSSVVALMAMVGMVIMLVGSVSILFGIEGRIGALMLLFFTAGGIYQHKREREVAMSVAEGLKPHVAAAGQPNLGTLQWSAFSGHLSSGLKNWALCGTCTAIAAWGTGPWSWSDRLAEVLR
jgi:uncharacterized membrane protein YphA (DoxX/SURF4 family)